MMLTDLADVCRRGGLDVIERPGWAGRGHGEMIDVRTIVCHHTGGAATGETPSMSTVERGRPDLAGPLAHLLLGRSGTVYVVAAGLCWHTGQVRDIDEGNPHAVGIEAEGTGRDPWPAVQYAVWVRLCRVLVDHYELTPARVLGHKEICAPVGRKTDPNLDMDEMRAAVARLQPGGTVAPAPTADVWGAPLPDEYTPAPGDTMTAGAALAWAAAHIGQVLDAVGRIEASNARLEKKVDQLLARKGSPS